ncbi:hypothetical protein D3C80_1786990 [compost metagenome]
MQKAIAAAYQRIRERLLQRPATGLHHRGIETLLYLIDQHASGFVHQLFTRQFERQQRRGNARTVEDGIA